MADAISIDVGTWFYFSLDLEPRRVVPIRFVRFVELKDRTAALVTRIGKSSNFPQEGILVPINTQAGYFRAGQNQMLQVWVFDGEWARGCNTVDLAAHWPGGILDKGAVTPSREVAERWVR